MTTQDGTRTLEKEQRGTLNDKDGNHKDTKNRKKKEREASGGKVLGQPRPAHRLKGKTMNGAPYSRP